MHMSIQHITVCFLQGYAIESKEGSYSYIVIALSPAQNRKQTYTVAPVANVWRKDIFKKKRAHNSTLMHLEWWVTVVESWLDFTIVVAVFLLACWGSNRSQTVWKCSFDFQTYFVKVSFLSQILLVVLFQSLIHSEVMRILLYSTVHTSAVISSSWRWDSNVRVVFRATGDLHQA